MEPSPKSEAETATAPAAAATAEPASVTEAMKSPPAETEKAETSSAEEEDRGSARTFTDDVFKNYSAPQASDKVDGCDDFLPEDHKADLGHIDSFEALIRDISDLHDNYRLLIISGGSQRDRLSIAAHLAPKEPGIRPRWLLKRGSDARFETIFERVGLASDHPGSQAHGFLVICADPSSVENWMPRFSEAVDTARRNGNGYFRCLVLTDSKRNFPRKVFENLRHHSIEIVGRTSENQTRQSYSHEEIFVPAGIQEERPFKEAVRDGIQRVLIRIAVLFGPLPEDRFSEFVESALGESVLDFTTGSGKTMTRSSRKAVDVWKDLRPPLLLECGLRLDTSRGSREIAFASPDLVLSAEKAAWQDGLAMWELLEILSDTKGFVLFPEDALEEQREVLASCISAMGSVAKQIPDIFAKRWLSLVCRQCGRWLDGRMLAVIPPAEDPALFIPWLAENFEATRRGRRLRNHFCQRVGLVCMTLLSEPESVFIVDRLITRLCDHGAPLIAWRLCWTLRQADAFGYAGHAKACLGRGDTETFWTIVHDLAWESARSPVVAAANLGMIRVWADSAEKEGSVYKRVLLGFVPAWLREHFSNRLESKERAELGSAIAEKDSVQYEALKKALLDPRFPDVFGERFLDDEVVEEASAAELKALALSSCLLWLCSNEPVDPPAVAFEGAAEILQEVDFEVLPLVKGVITACCGDLSDRLASLGFSEEDQKAYMRIQSILESLFKLNLI